MACPAGDRKQRMHNPIILSSQLFKMDMLVMSIVILCILSTFLYQVIAVLEKRFL